MKCGLELHMQVNTGKLFCRCPNNLVQTEKPDFVIVRKLRAVAGETGKVDIAAKAEQEKNKAINYECYNENTCLVELDEEPPLPIDKHAFRAALEIALLLNMRPVDEFHIMRKLIIDGSAVSGFQRTGLLARNGYIKTSMGDVRISTLSLEEDSARRIDDNTFSLDRMGIPLIEVVTEPDIVNPQHAREVAEKIGTLAKFTGKLIRGIGTIRQDVNVSIPDGARVEIKGVQDLRLMDTFVELEVERQEKLLEIKKMINVKLSAYSDLSEIFRNTKCSFLNNQTVYGMKLSKGKGLLGFKVQNNKTFGKEIADYVKVITGIKGILHTDELPAYGITEEEVIMVRKSLNCSDTDGFILVACDDEIKKVHEVINKRLVQAVKGVPEEVRAPNHADGTTNYLRPLPGGTRMYPETDVPIIRLKSGLISEIISNLSKTPDEKYDWLKNTGLNDELSSQLMRNNKKLALYELITDKTNADNKLTASLILENPAEKVKPEHLILIFSKIENNELVKEAVPEIIQSLIKKHDFSKILKKYAPLNTKELNSKVQRVIAKNRKLLNHPNKFGLLMNELMKSLRGRADAGLISKVLKKELMKHERAAGNR